jgi:outer membrane protein
MDLTGEKIMIGRQTRLMLVVSAVAALASLGSAQAKLGTVNMQEIFEKSAEGKKILARLREADQKNQEAVTRLDNDIRTLQTKLSTQRLTLTEEAAAQASADLDKKNIDRKRIAEDAALAWSELRDRLFKTFQDDLLAVIGRLGKEKGYDVIFEVGKSGVAYGNPAIDLTAEVIARYDASKAPAK